ncbi:phosphoenolpyruvate synthase [Arthrobacter sp. CAU 1506]|uniref:PEP/pyruvate-binding domain-containing protein n=1 Tax=Arthrobacter sp. CAU 1506 TaxID=2560052 RepID=UPI0010ABB52C|nr:PEP/pyruvate-binding domain-containing protein [Arthrobacter sp. CAU 1506]TJY67224.1 phosphoenolpyruvate synthase [Arthrobacter sp. CAU 1506]
MTYINNLDDVGEGDLAAVGGKGVGLGGLRRAGVPVPDGFVLTTEAYTAFVDANHLAARIRELAMLGPQAAMPDYQQASERIRTLFTGGTMPAEVAAELDAAYRSLGDGGPTVAVRSSATAEDLATASFAGQQDSYLNVHGAEALAAAVTGCWASLWTARAMSYRAREGIGPESVRLAVVVQRMVSADAAGVMFTANPANGRRDQIVVSAAWGLGESVVSGTVTPDNIVVDAESGHVLSRRTADKDTMTVYAEQGTREQPVPPERRRQPVLDDRDAAALAGYGAQIGEHFAAPQDIEWARTGDGFFFLQSRPITALPEPAAEPPDSWAVPYRNGLYFRASIVEQLPDPLSPLFADMIDGSVSRSLSALMAEVLGSNTIRETDVGLTTVNGYAYYFYRNWAMVRLMARTLPAVGALVRGKEHLGITGWREFSHPRYERVVADWSAKPIPELSGEELLQGVQSLLDACTVYYTAVQSVIPTAATSELSFRAFYSKVVRRKEDPPAVTFLLGFDSEPIRAEKSLYDLASWARGVPGLAPELLGAPATALADAQRSGSPPAGFDDALWRQWQPRFQAHLDRFGHAVYNLDFVHPVPADDPSPLLETVKFYLRGQGQDPYERQRMSAARREDHTSRIAARLGRTRRAAAFFRLLRWAQKAAPIREDALADVGLAWPLIRRMLLELGQRLAVAAVIAEPADVFWLRHRELVSAVDFGLAAPRTREVREDQGVPEPPGTSPVAITGADRPVRADAVEKRKMLWRGQLKAAAPQMLPESRLMDRAFGSMMPARTQQAGGTIKGIGASPGRVSASAQVLEGPEDFARMTPGDVLVARITTPAWTPLFAMASAVVTDVGGPLSHSSIVAREYGIPAVLGTGVATQRIASGEQIHVDGDAGTVTIEHPAAT